MLLLAALPATALQCEGQVVRVHDGDTITLRCPDRAPVKVRVANIDAPELHQAAGVNARDALVELTRGQRVRLASVATDRYERTVARIAVGERDLGLQLVADGWAWCGPRPDAECRRRQQAAKAARRGLWTDAQPQPPWQWRKANPRRD